MTDKVRRPTTALHSIAFKRELWTCTVNWTLITQTVERQARDLEVRGSNPGPGPNFSLEIKKDDNCLTYAISLIPQYRSAENPKQINLKFLGVLLEVDNGEQ